MWHLTDEIYFVSVMIQNCKRNSDGYRIFFGVTLSQSDYLKHIPRNSLVTDHYSKQTILTTPAIMKYHCYPK